MGKLVQCNIAAKSLDRSQIRLCYNSIAMRSLMLDTGYLVSLSLTFPISKVGVLIEPASWGCNKERR